MMRADLCAAIVAVALPLSVQRGVVGGVSVSERQVEAGTPVEITVTGTNPCGAVRIDYGDGTERVTHPLTEVPAKIRYVYRQAGSYRIRAEGMGNCDGEASTSITVLRPPNVPPAPTSRFLEMDSNGDGVVTLTEWRGSAREFRQYDLNRDGVLSGNELRAPEESAARPDGELIVDAKRRWTNTGVYVREGELVRVRASGTVQLSGDPADSGGPGGVESGRRAPNSPITSRPAGALIARVGESAAVYVGTAETFRAPASGQLYLGVNDDHLADNKGEFRVRIEADRRESLSIPNSQIPHSKHFFLRVGTLEVGS